VLIFRDNYSLLHFSAPHAGLFVNALLIRSIRRNVNKEIFIKSSPISNISLISFKFPFTFLDFECTVTRELLASAQ
jgi:hypothetical protein